MDFPAIIFLLPFLLAGHVTLVVASHNWWYGRLRGRRLTDAVQLFHLVLLIVLPLLWLPAAWPLIPAGPLIGRCYLVLSLAGMVLLVVVTLTRLRRVLPVEPVHQGTVQLDPKTLLGYSGSGSGWRGMLAMIPGNEVLHPVLTRYELVLDSAPPAWDGLRILHVSDLHFGKTPTREWHQAVMRLCAQEPTDLVFFTGDLVDGLTQHEWIPRTLGQLRPSIGSVGILGNHDTWHEPEMIERRLKRIGFHMVGGSVVRLEVRGTPLWIMGNERPWRGSLPVVPKACEGQMLIALCHTPDEAEWAARTGASLIFSGHVHGGQIRIPVFGPVIMPSRFGRKFDSGWFRLGKSLLHVSCGLGGSQPVRWRCPPEVTMITVRVPVHDQSS